MAEDPKAMFTLGALIEGGMYGSGKQKVFVNPKMPRPCLKCGKNHYHNNSFCSAECCEEYKNGKSNTFKS